MGQQQLLLLVLSAVIVGVAIVSGINLAQDSQESAIRDTVEQEIAVIASQARSYYLKPASLGGGSRTFVGFDVATIGMDTTETATYALSGASSSTVTVTGTPIDARVSGISATVTPTAVTIN
jgi:hypothetical protein